MTAPRPLWFRGVTLVDPRAETVRVGDLLVVDRTIAVVGQVDGAPDGVEVVDAPGVLLAPALVDAGVFRADLAACAVGGIATALLMPDQDPPLDDPALVERAERLGKPHLWVRPLAAATRGLLGRELAELALLAEAGAVAVATGRQAVADAAVWLRVLRYAAGLGLVVVAHAEDPALAAGGVATEGRMATRLGLPAAPACAEALVVARDLRLAREAGAALHFACLSTAEAIELVRMARAAGQDVTAGTSPAYALLDEEALAGFRSFARLSPPLRSAHDRAAVLQGLADGTLSMLTSRHDPRTTEEKRLPFADAAPGAADGALLLSLGVELVRAGHLSWPRLFQCVALGPAARFGLPAGRLEPGAPADLVLVDPDHSFRIAADRLPGLGRNTPFDGRDAWGRALMLVKGGAVVFRAGPV
ncbi:MAG: dihydroorotase [Sphingomonadaceae bacterium]|uniref:dihydroorotase n=1 Tax=Thermaurantiacus sp. TaxID=2820283 RepID=UPI00298ED3B1|nr:dihydroorotase [Thermaurantiacus sp.]MCS6987611.1 dihydroorotase [Sphingomonadaceae bacterium]MDW8415212.1 dihydroorotase [Thermaurantiacus sp.]